MNVRAFIAIAAILATSITSACSSSNASAVHCCLSADKTSCRCNGKGQPNEGGCYQATEVRECTPSMLALGASNYCCNHGTSCDCATATSAVTCTGTSVSSCSASVLAGGTSDSGGPSGSGGKVCREGDHACTDDGDCKCPGVICEKKCDTCERRCTRRCSTDYADSSDCKDVGGADGTAWRCKGYTNGARFCWF